MATNSKEIVIVIDVADKASGNLDGVKHSLLAIDEATQRTRNMLLQIGRGVYRAQVHLIDKITPAGSRIQNFLRSLAAKQYLIGVRLTESVFGKIRSLESTLMRIAGRAWTIGINLRDNVTGKLKSFTEGALMSTGAGMLGTMGAGFGVANALGAYADFEKSMSRVAAVRQLSKDSPEMQMLTEQAKQIGMETQFTRSEAAQAQYYAALAGYDTKSILAVTPHLVNLAAAGDLELGRASDILTDTATALGLDPTEFYKNKQGQFVSVLEGYSDMLAKIQAISNTDIGQAYEALKFSAPVLGTIGRGKSPEYRMQVAEDALIATGLMADAGIKSSMSGTALRAVFSRFSGENRNSLFGLRTLGVEVQRDGEMLTPGEIIKNLKHRVDEGIPVEHLTEIMEAFAGEKIHADTRRKLDSFIADTMANGGKIGSAGLMKMSAMLAGQEAMSGLLAMLSGDWDKKAAEMDKAAGSAADMAKTQMDNLAGSVTYLQSAFDSLRQSFFEGGAGDGIRAFVDSLTELTSRATKLFSDGIQFGDLTKLAMDAVERLKNKFMELDGIGSILAGGALMAGLVKIGSAIQKTIGYFKTLKGLEIGQRMGGATGAGSKGGTVSAAQSVGTMNVSAGVVNINGKVGGTAGGVGGRRVGDQTIIDRYNQEKARIRGTGAPPPPSMRSTFTGGAKMGAAFAGIFALLDVFNAKSMSAERIGVAESELSAARTEYDRLKASGAESGHLAQQLAQVQRLESVLAQTAQENKIAERDTLAGATGSVLGAAIGAGLGSFLPGFGTMLGGIIGSVVGEKLAVTAAHTETPSTVSENDFFGIRKPRKEYAGTTWEGIQLGSSARRRSADEIESARRPFENLRGLDSARRRVADAAEETMKIHNAISSKFKSMGLSQYQQDNGYDYYQRQAAQLAEQLPGQVAANQQKGWDLLRDLFGRSTAHAATLSEEQLLQQAQMERPRTIGEALAEKTQPAAEMFTGESAEVMPPDLSAFEDTQSTLDGFLESFSTFGDTISEYLSGATESITGFGESIGESLTGAFEGATETLSAFGESIGESLTGAFETAGEMISTFGDTIGEGLTGVLEGAGEMFTGFGDLVTSALTTAQGAAESALAAIGASFESARASIMGAWGELPGFFGGIFDGLGGVAAAAGSAIYSGLTSVIGAVIGAWQSAAATVSSIISSISSMASSAASMIPSFGGGSAFAEGGFVNSPTQALIGEAGAEVVIPLSGSKRTRALDLFEKTAQILGGEASIPMSDFAADNVPELSNSFSGFTVDAPTPITPNGNQSANSSEVNMGGINVSFTISGANNPQEVMETIKENLAELADRIAGQLGKTVNESFNNMSVGH